MLSIEDDEICQKTSLWEKLEQIWIGFLLVFLEANITS